MSCRHLIFLSLILLVAAFFRFHEIAGPSLWMDEIVSIELAMGHGTAHDFFPDAIIRDDQPDPLSIASAAPWWDIWNRLQITTHPPLYFVVLRWWMDLFDDSPGATRSLSAIFSLAAVVIFFDVCRLLHGPRIALFAAAIMGMAIAQIDIAQEARSYPLLILLGMTSCDLLMRIAISGATHRRLISLAIALAAMLLTHYFAAGAFAALGIYAVIRLGGRDRLRTVAAIFAAAAITAISWGYPFYWQMRSLPNFDPSYVRDTGAHHAVHVLLSAAELPLRYCIGESFAERVPAIAEIITGGMIIAMAIWPRRRTSLLLWILWAGGIILSVAALDLAHQSLAVQFIRYTILASPAVYAILAGVHWPRLRNFSVLPCAVVAFLFIAAGLRAQHPVPAKQDFHQLSQIIDTFADPNELLVFYNDSQWVSPGVWYIGYKYYSPQSRHPWVTLRHPAEASLLAQIGERHTLWLIGRQPEIDGPIVLPGWRPDTVWQTTAGRACLMRPTSDVLPPVH